MNSRQGKISFFLICFLTSIAFQALAQKNVADSLKQVMSLSSGTERVELLFKITDAYLQFAPKKASECSKEARFLAVQLQNDTLEAMSLRYLGKVNFRMGNFKDAILFYEQAIKIYKRLEKNIEVSNLLDKTANSYMNMGNYTEALNKSFEGYKLSEKIGDKGGMSNALISSGNVYRAMKNYNKAILDFEKAIILSEESGNFVNEATCLNGLSNVYGDLGKNDTAINCLLKALAIYRKSNDRYNEGKILNNIGTCYMDQNKLDLATDYFLQAQNIQKELGDNRGGAISLANLGAIAFSNDNPDKAIEYFTRALDRARISGASDLLITIFENLSECYSKKGDFEKSLEFFKMEGALKDSIFNNNLSESIAEMQAQYDVKKAENETRSQQAQNRLIMIASAVGGILLIVVVFFLWNRAVVRKRTNIRLNQQKTEIEIKNTALNEANLEIESKNKDITDSIQYARRIQEAILPEVEFNATFGDSAFVLYRPKDIVSGDLYWMAQTDEYLLFAAVDCTGHGVPGAFVSIVCSNLLSQSVKEHGFIRPDEILNDVNIRLSETLRQRQDTSRVRDGMDIALCSIHKKTLMLSYAGAFNPAWIFHNNEFVELAPDKFPVGLFEEEELRKFNFKELQLSKGDKIYVFSDGYSDQFGGPLGKKYKRSVFFEFVKSITHLPIKDQGKLLDQEHLRWKGSQEQIDDILVIGVQV